MRLLKFDTCFSDSEGEVMDRFVAMRDALLAANASIVYMLCEWVRRASGGAPGELAVQLKDNSQACHVVGAIILPPSALLCKLLHL